MLSTILAVLFHLVLITADPSTNSVTLQDDPSLFPGHLEPLGAKQPKTDIEVLSEYPSPTDYFTNFIRPGRPFLLKGGAKYQKAFKLWNDEYLSSFAEAEKELVQVEPNKKEIREAQGFEIPFKEFVQRYGTEKIYMVNKVPSFLQKDVMMPPPLRCNTTRDLMLDHVTWMSSGGTKSVLHQYDLDNINCLFRGEKDLLFINPIKYGSKVPIDKPTGGYSSLDVDKVNFTKYPSMREVEYIDCHMKEGDCLFIPRGWYHQVNSRANENKQNIAVNIWFRHDPHHKPEGCELAEEKASLDHFTFPGMDSLIGGGGEEDEDEGQESSQYQMLDFLQWTLTQTKKKRANFKTFTSLLKRTRIISERDQGHVELDDNFLALAKTVFDIVNVDNNKFLDAQDFTMIFDSDSAEEIETQVSSQLRNLQMILESLSIQQASPSEKEEVETTPEKEEL